MSYLTSTTLMRRAHGELDAAHQGATPREQFLGAHMAALRAAAAVLALTPKAGPKRGKVRSAWVQLAEVSPQWQPWVEYYTDSARVRAELESGVRSSLDPAQARQAMAIAGKFLATVEEYLTEHKTAIHNLAQAS